MSRSDQWVLFIALAAVVTHISAFIAGLVTNRLPYLMSILNLACSLILVLYWIQKQLRITQHIFETREILVLCLEVTVVVVSVYSLASNTWNTSSRIFQYIVSGIHLLVLIAFILFMLTFKMKKLI